VRAHPRLRRPLAAPLAVATLLAAAPAAQGADRVHDLPVHFFATSATVTVDYTLHLRFREEMQGPRTGEMTIRKTQQMPFRPGRRYGELRMFARPFPRGLSSRVLLDQTYRNLDAGLTTERQTVTGWVDDIDREGQHHGRAQFTCTSLQRGSVDRAIFGIERRRERGWRAVFLPLRSLHLNPVGRENAEACRVTPPHPSRTEGEDGDLWAPGIVRTIGGLVESPAELALSREAGRPAHSGIAGWSRLGAETAARFTLSDATLRRNRIDVPIAGTLRSRTCRGESHDLTFDVVECRHDLRWRGRLTGRKLCPNGRGFWQVLRRSRGGVLPGGVYCRGRRLPGH
jgi:hypothetical protein